MDFEMLTLNTINQITMSKTVDAMMDKQQEHFEQLDLDYPEARKKIKMRLGKVEVLVRASFDYDPLYIRLNNSNALNRFIWEWNKDDIPAESILRCARKLRATGEYDTEDNIKHRSNLEVAHREYFGVDKKK